MTATARWPAFPGRDEAAVPRVRWRAMVWILLAAAGAIHGWAGRMEMTPDGIAYLDLADAFLRGDWAMAFNRLWSPLYPALLAAALAIAGPLGAGEFPAVHLTNFVIFLGALAAFEFLLGQLIAWHRTAVAPGRAALPEWLLRAAGYVVFASSSLQLTPVPLVSPDLLVSVFVYLALGLALKLHREPGRRAPALLLGAVLGGGFLAKAAMLPLALVIIASVALSTRGSGTAGAARSAAAPLLGLAVVSGLLILAFVLTGQGVTLGESGALNYAYHINGLPYVHWQGEPSGYGRPVHPTREILNEPPVYEFAAPIGGTYAPWVDPAYWYEGLRPRFDAGGHLANLVRSARVVAGVLLRSGQILLPAGVLVLAALGARPGWRAVDLRPYAALLLPLLAAVAVYATVWLERRFVAPFLAPSWLGLLASIRLPREAAVERAALRAVTIALVFIMAIAVYGAYAMTKDLGLRHAADQHLAVARHLEAIGVREGDHVALINDWPGGSDAYWARLARVRIIAEMPACRTRAGHHCLEGPPGGVQAFVRAAPALRVRILAVLAGSGAEAVVMRNELSAPLPGWRRIPGTTYDVYLPGREEASSHGRP